MSNYIVLFNISCHILLMLLGNCSHGDLRLIGPKEHSGTIEICYDGVWGTIQTDFWNDILADFICKQLGYNLTG